MRRYRRGTCQLPPRGWFCTLPQGHDGNACPTVAKWWNLKYAGWGTWR